jgi:predicted transcriptional regulator
MLLKSIEEFASYVHKKTNNLYTRHICKECFNAQHQKYKKSMKPRVCIRCNEKKDVKFFPKYKSIPSHYKQANICLRCTSELSRIKYGNRRESKGEVVPEKPNTYLSEQQRKDGFELMTALGFTFSPETGRWSKEGFKNPDGTFVRIEEKKRLAKEKIQKEIEELNIWNKIRYLREQGNSVNDISTITGINRTAVQKFLQNGKEIKLRNQV